MCVNSNQKEYSEEISITKRNLQYIVLRFIASKWMVTHGILYREKTRLCVNEAEIYNIHFY